jgi:hypothetical protein
MRFANQSVLVSAKQRPKKLGVRSCSTRCGIAETCHRNVRTELKRVLRALTASLGDPLGNFGTTVSSSITAGHGPMEF